MMNLHASHPWRHLGVLTLFMLIGGCAVVECAEEGFVAGTFGSVPLSVLENGGFENGARQRVERWQQTAAHPPQRSDAQARSGDFSMHVFLKNEGPQPSEGNLIYETETGIRGGQTYHLEFWIKEIERGASYVQQYTMEWLDQAGERLEGEGIALTDFQGGKEDWERIRPDSFKAPPAATGVRLRFRFVTGAIAGGSGEVYLDDVSLKPDAAETPKDLNLHGAILTWRNGDAVEGRLMPGEGGHIHWASPVFKDEMVVHSASLSSIRFPKSSTKAAEAFRIATVTGELFNADLVDSDSDSILVATRRHGRFRLDRQAVYSIHRVENANRVFEGSRFEDWTVALGGPVQQMLFKVFEMDPPEWKGGPFPDFSDRPVLKEGKLTSAYFDPGFSDRKEGYAMVIEGTLNIKETGNHLFQAAADHGVRFWVDDQPVAVSSRGRIEGKELSLQAGPHVLKMEYVHGKGIGEVRVWWSGPGFKNRSLVRTNREWGWTQGPDGYPVTRLKRSGLFREFDLPDHFELEMELSSSVTPQFIVAMGRDETSAESDGALRLEARGNEIMLVVNDSDPERVMTLEEDTREVRLRLSYDAESKSLDVFDLNGRFLASVEHAAIDTGPSGIYIRNQGEDLVVRRVDVYQGSQGVRDLGPDASKSRVHLLDGTVLPGTLHLDGGKVQVVSADGQSTEVDLDVLDRMVRPEAILASLPEDIQLIYQDGGLVRGTMLSVEEDAMMLQTRFAREPVAASLQGLSMIQFNASPSLAQSPKTFRDELYLASGRLRGEMTFGLERATMGWKPAGAQVPLALSGIGHARILRHDVNLSHEWAVDKSEYPTVLHLRNGEIIPCRMLSYQADEMAFQSPFLETQRLASAWIKAIEFQSVSMRKNRRTVREDRNRQRFNNPQGVVFNGAASAESREDDMDKDLLHALTTPRFRRQQPSTHLLVAKNGDMRRGRLKRITEQELIFESRSRSVRIPLDRIAKVVAVLQLQASDAAPDMPPEPKVGWITVLIQGGSRLQFTPTSFDKGQLLGRSALYGPVSVPTEHLNEFFLGGLTEGLKASEYEDWFMRPAAEPVYDEARSE